MNNTEIQVSIKGTFIPKGTQLIVKDLSFEKGPASVNFDILDAFRKAVKISFTNAQNRVVGFTTDQLDYIRDAMVIVMEQYSDTPSKQEALDVINLIQNEFGYPEYESIEEFQNDTSCDWTEKSNEP